MASEWQEFAFGELCTITRGASPRPINDFLSSKGMPWIKIADATSSDSRFLSSTNECIKLEGVRSSVRVFPGDLILSNSATPGLPKFVTIDACIHDGWMLLRDFKGVVKQYAYWLLLNERKNLVAQGNGSVFTNLKTDILKLHRVKVPTLATQVQIAKILDSIADKIDLNRRINQTLEAMAQAIFKSWFVDFEPVKAKVAAKQEGRDSLRSAMSAISGKPDAELDTLPPEQYEQLAATAALFPDEMEASELGEIPRGWAFKSVGDVARFASGKVDVSSLNEDIYISTENMLQNRAGVTPATSLPSAITVPSFATGQILVSNIRPYFKKIWMARFDGGRSPDVLAFEPAGAQSAEFLYNLMYQDAFFEFMTRTAKGAKMPRGDKDAIMGWKFPCPDELLMVAFSEKVRPIYAHTESLTLQSKSLAELRDTLLPKLLSGELSVAAIAPVLETTP
jgi:type I restriction enzyme S subunit